MLMAILEKLMSHDKHIKEKICLQMHEKLKELFASLSIFPPVLGFSSAEGT